MTPDTAAEYALVVTTQEAAQPPPELARLSVREQELVTLVGQGSTDAEIAVRRYISISTVRSHLDGISNNGQLPAPRRPHPPASQADLV
jgi:DNA-binding NarL/FixJ family response regulator